MSEAQDAALIVALVGAPDNYLEHNRLQKLVGGGQAVEGILRNGSKYITWRKDGPSLPAMPTDWQQLVGSSSTSWGHSCPPMHACHPCKDRTCPQTGSNLCMVMHGTRMRDASLGSWDQGTVECTIVPARPLCACWRHHAPHGAKQRRAHGEIRPQSSSF